MGILYNEANKNINIQNVTITGGENGIYSTNGNITVNETNITSAQGIVTANNNNNQTITGDLEEVVCEVEIKENKKYNIYIKLNDKAQYQYILFKNEQEGYFALRGNTKLIKELEATQIEYGLSESDKDFLATSKDLSNKFSALKDDAEYEDSLIKKNLDMEEKTHYVFTKDDILN